jgi:hypothetical protein
MENVKEILIKSSRLDKYFRSYEENDEKRAQVIDKFEAVWGSNLASHFLMKYNNAEDLILALDSDNLDKFIKNF